MTGAAASCADRAAASPGCSAVCPRRFADGRRRVVVPSTTEVYHEHPCPFHRRARCDARAVRRDRAPARGSARTPPDGLEYHVAFVADGSFRVSEVWDSREKLEAFAAGLMPVSTSRSRARRGAGSARGPQHHPALGSDSRQSLARRGRGRGAGAWNGERGREARGLRLPDPRASDLQPLHPGVAEPVDTSGLIHA